jgi:hypothetical protein
MAIGQRRSSLELQYGTCESGLPILGVYKETNDRGREEIKEGTKKGEKETEEIQRKEKSSVLMRGGESLFFLSPKPSESQESNFLMPPVLWPQFVSSMHIERS